MGSHTSSNHQPYPLPNCLMMRACERKALCDDRRTQGHATPKSHAVKLLPLYTLGHFCTCLIGKRGAWCLRNRFTDVALADSACSRWVESPCTRPMVPTGQLKRTRGGVRSLRQEECPKLVGFGHGRVWYLVPDFHTFTSKIAPHRCWDTRQ